MRINKKGPKLASSLWIFSKEEKKSGLALPANPDL